MGFINRLFGKNKEKNTEVEKPNLNSVESLKKATEDFFNPVVTEEIAVLSYGAHQIPVEAFRAGVKMGATIKAHCVKTNSFIPLNELGDELLIFDPKDGLTTTLIACTNPEFDDIKRYVYGTANATNHQPTTAYDEHDGEEDYEPDTHVLDEDDEK